MADRRDVGDNLGCVLVLCIGIICFTLYQIAKVIYG